MASVHFANAMAGWLPDRATIDGLLTSLGGDDRADDTAATGWGLLPGPFYTPETSLGLGIALVGLYRTGDKRPETPLSPLTLSGFASLTGTFGFESSEERRVGKECVHQCRSRCSPFHQTKKIHKNT